MEFKRTIERFRQVVPATDFWSIRLEQHDTQSLQMRQGRLQSPRREQSRGAHITLVRGGGFAYAATCELSREGLREACERALDWLETSRRHALFPASLLPRPRQSGIWHDEGEIPWESWSLEDKIDVLARANQALKTHSDIIDWRAAMVMCNSRVLLHTSDGTEIDQHFSSLAPGMWVAANRGAETQIRTGGGAGAVRQGGLEVLASFGFPDTAPALAGQALALLEAPECPAGRRDLLLMPDQMMLQIHESIGHPLELDRILGDERNMAGGSFVSPDQFGSFRYGSDLLNVTFDPGVQGEVGSRRFDDEGTPAERHFLIRRGILQRPLGGALSQARSGLEGVACARAIDWNRPAIDRMGNINLEPGEQSLEEMIGGVEQGILMETNRSWSIDHYRHKFQFSCEMGHLIRDGEVGGLVRNPNYRGISGRFWRDLAGVGNAASRQILGTSDCGKGEPNQLMSVGHASPPCLFRQVEVFGGD